MWITKALFMIAISFGSAEAFAACFDPAVEAGAAFKDPLTESLVITQTLPPNHGQNHGQNRDQKLGDTVVGIGVKGLFFGCKIPQASIAAKSIGAKKFNLFLPLRNASLQGFELDISSEGRRVLAGRPIQVPWSVVDRTLGVTAACTASTASAFEAFLYGALRKAGARRCTQAEIETIVGAARAPVGRTNGATSYLKSAPVKPPARK